MDELVLKVVASCLQVISEHEHMTDKNVYDKMSALMNTVCVCIIYVCMSYQQTCICQCWAENPKQCTSNTSRSIRLRFRWKLSRRRVFIVDLQRYYIHVHTHTHMHTHARVCVYTGFCGWRNTMQIINTLLCGSRVAQISCTKTYRKAAS